MLISSIKSIRSIQSIPSVKSISATAFSPHFHVLAELPGLLVIFRIVEVQLKTGVV